MNRNVAPTMIAELLQPIREWITGFPLVTILAAVMGWTVVYFAVGWWIRWCESRGTASRTPRMFRYFFLPTLALHVLLQFVLDVPSSHMSLKITETILSIFLLSFAFVVANHLFFSENNILSTGETIPKLGRDVLNFVLTLVFGAVILSSVWGLNLGDLLTALGVGSLVIGLALQEPLGNLFNGISLLMARPFHRGDWVQIGEEKGKIVNFNWRSVKMLNRFNELVIIPNNVIGKATVKNLSRPSRIHAEWVTIGFSYDDHPEQVKQALADMALQTIGILAEPPPQPLTVSYDDFFITYGLKFYIEDFEDEIELKDRLMTKIYDLAAAQSFTIPFPIRDVRLAGDDA